MSEGSDGTDERDDDDLFGDQDEDDEDEAADQVQTICHYCGGGGMVADPKLAIVGGAPRSIDNGRACTHCDSNGHFTGIIPPV